MKFPTEEFLYSLYLKDGWDDVMPFDDFKDRYSSGSVKWPLADRFLEGAWHALGDVPTRDDENGDAWILDERFETPWVTFEKGVCVMDVWHWFDAKHSKGVHWLMYGGKE